MDNSSDAVLTKKLLLVSKSFVVLSVLVTMLYYCIITSIPSNAGSLED